MREHNRFISAPRYHFSKDAIGRRSFPPPHENLVFQKANECLDAMRRVEVKRKWGDGLVRKRLTDSRTKKLNNVWASSFGRHQMRSELIFIITAAVHANNFSFSILRLELGLAIYRRKRKVDSSSLATSDRARKSLLMDRLYAHLFQGL